MRVKYYVTMRNSRSAAATVMQLARNAQHSLVCLLSLGLMTCPYGFPLANSFRIVLFLFGADASSCIACVLSSTSAHQDAAADAISTSMGSWRAEIRRVPTRWQCLIRCDSSHIQ